MHCATTGIGVVIHTRGSRLSCASNLWSTSMAYDAQIKRTADHIGPKEDIWDIYDLPPTVVGRQQYGPRHRPINDVSDPGGWHPGMPYGKQAWANYKRSQLV